MAKLEASPTITQKGIFDIRRHYDGYATTEDTTFEGDLIAISEKDLEYRACVGLSRVQKSIFGVSLTLRNQRGEEPIDFPREFSLTDRQAMRGQRVRYSVHSWSSPSEGTKYDYKLEILSGSLSGEELTRSVFV